MRKLIVTNIVSLDGYFEGPLLLGGKTYEGFKGFWPQTADNPTRPPRNGDLAPRRRRRQGRRLGRHHCGPDRAVARHHPDRPPQRGS